MGLKLLLTGDPKVGKSTIIKNSLANVVEKAGFWTSELTRKGQRYGFLVESDKGQTVILADDGRPTPYQIGRYYVDVGAFEQFLSDLDYPEADDLIYIDEIGRMQLLSATFKVFIKELMTSDNFLLGTIGKINDDPFVTEVKSRSDTVVIEVTPENRESMQTVVDAAVENRQLLARLSTVQFDCFVGLLKQTADPILLYKLFYNTLDYVTTGRVMQRDSGALVNGNHSDHRVREAHGTFSCNCPLFASHGRCSHVFAVRVMRAK